MKLLLLFAASWLASSWAAPPSLPRDSPVNFDDLDDLAYEDALGDSFEFDGIEPPDDVEIVPGAAGIASSGLPMPEALAAPSTPPTTNVTVPLTPSTERSCPASNYSGFSLIVTPSVAMDAEKQLVSDHIDSLTQNDQIEPIKRPNRRPCLHISSSTWWNQASPP